ncbi:MAG: lamin tail domain-containing protein [Bryobacterales bacterium]|nr:lamin tail domain-containing protein [Bryobacterales bacterium]
MIRISFLGMLSLLSASWPLASPAQGAGTVVISQIYGGGGNSGASLRNDFVELFNRGDAGVDITGWTVQYASASGQTWDRTPLSGTLAPGQYYLVREAQGSGGTQALPAPDAVGAIALSATSGKIALVRSTTNLTGFSPSSTDLVDLVGYGEAGFSLGNPTASLSNSTSAMRRGDGCTDTRDNGADFIVGPPAPRNTESARNPCVSGHAPDTTPPSVMLLQPEDGAIVTGMVTLSARATDNVAVVAVQFLVDGKPAEVESVAFPFSLTWDSSKVQDGPHTLSAAARDAAGNRALSAAVTVEVRNETLKPSTAEPKITSAVNGASFMPGPVAPGELVTIFGSDLGPPDLVRQDLGEGRTPFKTLLANTRVLFDGVAAPVFFTTSTAVSAFAPYSLAGRTSAEVVVEFQNKLSNPITLDVAGSAPGIFAADASGRGQAWALNEDNTSNGPGADAPKGSLITFYATGGGATNPAGDDGLITTDRPAALNLPVSVRIGSADAQVVSAGTTPGAISGMMQVTARVPQDLASGGPLPIELTVGGVTSQPGVFVTVEGGDDSKSATESKLSDLRTNPRVPPLAELPNDRIAVPADWLALVSWNIQVGGASPTSDTRPPMVKSVLNALFGGSYQLLAAQEIPSAESSEFFRTLLPGGSAMWQASFFDSTDSMDNGLYYQAGVKLRDAAPLFVIGDRDEAGRYLPDTNKAVHPPQVAQFEAGNFDFTVITLHLTFAGGDTAASTAEFSHLLDYLDWYFQQPGHDPDVIVCGDFNTPSALSGDTGRDGLTLDSVLGADPRFQTGERRFVVTVHEPTSRRPAASGGGPANNYDHCVLSADTMEEFIQARRVDTTILTDHPDDPEQRLTSDHFPMVSLFRTQGPGVILDHRPTIRPSHAVASPR